MARETTYSGMMGDWQRLISKILANLPQLSHLEPFLNKLTAVLAQAVEVNKQQDAMRAAKQEASRDMRKLASEGQRLTTILRATLKEHYGIREEKLAEFGLQPYRGRARKRRRPRSPRPPPPRQPPALPPPHPADPNR